MRLLDRIAVLIKADAHGVVESIEDRRLLAKQYLREAELALDSKRELIADITERQRRLMLEAKRIGELTARLDADVELAVSGGQQDLARAAIRKLLPLREAERRSSERLVTLKDEAAGASERLAAQEQQFEILKARLCAELAQLETTTPGEDGFRNPVVTEDDVELELLRRQRGACSHDGQAIQKGAER